MAGYRVAGTESTSGAGGKPRHGPNIGATQLSMLNAQTAGQTGLNRITQSAFSTSGRSEFAGQVTMHGHPDWAGPSDGSTRGRQTLLILDATFRQLFAIVASAPMSHRYVCIMATWATGQGCGASSRRRGPMRFTTLPRSHTCGFRSTSRSTPPTRWPRGRCGCLRRCAIIFIVGADGAVLPGQLVGDVRGRRLLRRGRRRRFIRAALTP